MCVSLPFANSFVPRVRSCLRVRVRSARTLSELAMCAVTVCTPGETGTECVCMSAVRGWRFQRGLRPTLGYDKVLVPHQTRRAE